MDLTEEQWTFVSPLLPTPKVRQDGRGRPWKNPRDVLNGILWILRTGAPWADMQDRYPPYATCFRRFKMWTATGAIVRVLAALAEHLVRQGKMDLAEAFVDGTHAGAKKRGLDVGRTRRGLATKIVAITDSNGLPVSVTIASGQSHEVTLVEPAIECRLTRKKPERLIGDKAFDSAPLENRLKKKKSQLIAPTRKKNETRRPDGRCLRRYKRRWKVERFFAWLLRFRRVSTRYENKASHFLGFVHLGCLVILLRHL